MTDENDEFFASIGAEVKAAPPYCRRMLKLKTAEGKPIDRMIECGSYFARDQDKGFDCNCCGARVRSCTCERDMVWCTARLGCRGH